MSNIRTNSNNDVAESNLLMIGKSESLSFNQASTKRSEIDKDEQQVSNAEDAADKRDNYIDEIT